MDYNSMAFTPEEVEKGLHLGLLSFLLDYNSKSKDHYNDIHITTDGYCTIIEWDHVPFSHEWGGQFVYRTFEDLENESLEEDEDYSEKENDNFDFDEYFNNLINKPFSGYKKKEITKDDLNNYMSELDDKKEGE